ncbi:GDP-L-fucose synthase family protein [Candidatus Pelagibacter sp. HIMB1636]|uniref:GDP-L-fucose synthase family protein n=1 Tax=unclassified Candidatus Pelagibacter TaxID=2647897 RepID=UPI003F856900
MISKNSKIFVAGHRGLVGSAVLRRLKIYGFKNILTITKKKLDLTDQSKTFNFLKKNKPKIIIICSAKVGGILANDTYRGEFIYNNLQIQNNLIHGAYLNKIKNLIFLGSSCVYPRDCKQPIKEKYLLSGLLEKTNEPYAVAKIAGIKLCESYNYQYGTNYVCLMPSNTFGPNDNYDLKTSHFIPALIRKAHEIKRKKSKILNLWGSGKVKREVIYVDDIADACIYFMNKKTQQTLINIGYGKDYTIIDIAKKILKVVGVKAQIKFDRTKPDGTPQKLLDISKAKKYGWKYKTKLDEGLIKAYRSYINSK